MTRHQYETSALVSQMSFRINLTVGCFLRPADWGNVSNIVQCETKRVSLSTLFYLKSFHWKVPFRRSKKPYTDDYERTKKCEGFFSFKLSLYRWFCFPKNQIQNKRNYQVLSPTVEPRYNEGPRDWQNLFAITRFRYIEVLFPIFCYYWGKDNRSLYRGLYIEVLYIEVPL